MKLKSFRIKNYKSIVDSGICYLEDDLTIFAGKNESGKSSIIEAFEDFNINKNISEDAKPISNEELIPEIECDLEYSHDELEKYLRILNITDNSKNLSLKIIKIYPNKYTIHHNEKEINISNGEDKEKKKLEKINKEYQIILNRYNQNFKPRSFKFFIFNINDLNKTFTEVQEYYNNLKSTYLSIFTQANQQEIKNQILSEVENLFNSIKEFLNKEKLSDLIPNFVLFKSFEDELPNEIKYEDFEKKEIVKDLALISNLDIKILRSENDMKKRKHKEYVNTKLNSDYAKYWQQDVTTIDIDWNNVKINFWIKEERDFFKPKQRSRGKQWHLSFYIKLSARVKSDSTNIILIDEPGLFLHAKAQKDIYNKLKDNSKDNQILFTTHSPYLIKSEELEKIRLVYKDGIEKGTIIENRVEIAPKSDNETFTPILTAIGLTPSDSIINNDKEKNIIIEGFSDYCYLQGFKILLDYENYNFINGGGAGNLGKVGAILSGWGCKVRYLFDFDKGKKDGAKNLKNKWHIKTEDILVISKNKEEAIEDLFLPIEFSKYILNDDSIKLDNISKYLKENKNNISKIILSRSFLSKVKQDKVELSKETLSKVKELFERLEKSFEENENE